MGYPEVLGGSSGCLAGGCGVNDVVEGGADRVYPLIPLQQVLAALPEGQQALHLVNACLCSSAGTPSEGVFAGLHRASQLGSDTPPVTV